MKLIEFDYEGQMIRATHHSQKSKRLVLMAHGFTGNKIDHKGFAVSLAKKFHAYGYNVIRFDFLGNGESDGCEKDYAPQSEMAQLQFLLNHLNLIYDEIVLFGFSFGGMIVSQVAAMNNNTIKNIILLNPAGNMPEIVDDFLSQSKKLESGYDYMGYFFSEDLIKDIKSFDTYANISDYKGQVFIIQGEADEVVSLEAFKKYQSIYQNNIKSYLLEGCDHCFRGIDQMELLFSAADDIMKILQENK